MHLVDDVYLVSSHLWRNAHLLVQAADIVYRVVAGCVKLVYGERTLLVERLARLAVVARLAVGGGVLTIYGLCKDTRTGGLSHTTRPAKKIGVGKSAGVNGILQCCGKRFLCHHRLKGVGAIFSCGYNVVFHKSLLMLLGAFCVVRK